MVSINAALDGQRYFSSSLLEQEGLEGRGAVSGIRFLRPIQQSICVILIPLPHLQMILIMQGKYGPEGPIFYQIYIL